MYHKQIRENAIFIADSHYPHHGKDLLKLLIKIEKKEIITDQMFLMGDNFDLLFGYNNYIQKFSKKLINKIIEISNIIEIHYFEGNHDFLLSDIFKNINIYTRAEQPIIFKLQDKTVAISHGDKYLSSLGYNIYSKILRNKYFILSLRPFEKFIIDYIMEKLDKKNICHNFSNFENRVDEILEAYNKSDIIIEGHFHQGKIIKNYYSLPSLACQKKIAIIKNDKIEFILFR